MSRTSTNREASVKTTRPTPVQNIAPSTTATGRNSQVAWNGWPITATMRTSGTNEKARFTRPTPTAATTKTERGT